MSLLRIALQIVALAGPALFSCASAGAAETTSSRVLVIGVVRGHAADLRLTKGLSDHFAQTGLPSADGTLAASDRMCGEAGCMEALGARVGANLVVSADIQQNAPNIFFVTMALLDRLRNAPFQVKAPCDQCTQELLAEKLADLADQLILQSRAAPQVIKPVAPTPPAVPTVPIVPLPGGDGSLVVPDQNGGVAHKDVLADGFFTNWSARRKLLLGVFGGLTGAFLITSITLTALDGTKTDRPCNLLNNSKECLLDTVGFYGAGYVLTGALVVGAVITLAWPSKPSTPSPKETH